MPSLGTHSGSTSCSTVLVIGKLLESTKKNKKNSVVGLEFRVCVEHLQSYNLYIYTLFWSGRDIFGGSREG